MAERSVNTIGLLVVMTSVMMITCKNYMATEITAGMFVCEL